LKEDHIVIRPVQKPRQNWEEAFREMHEVGDDELLIDDMLEDDTWD